MNKTAIINARIDPILKERAESILNKVGLSAAEAVRLFYTQVCLQKGLPFEAKIPNKSTIKAMADAERRKTNKANQISDIFEDL
jgi:DNA-damage-inducible protein J